MAQIIKGTDALYLNAKEKLYISDFIIDGERAPKPNNGKIVFDCKNLVVKDCQTTEDCTVYNIFEQSQSKTPIESAKMTNVTIYPELTHNILNLYNIADNANIEISECSFDLNVKNTNPLRLSNLSNASNVTVTFKNINWTYENKAIEDADLIWASLILIQPFGKDNAHTGNLDYYKTWKFVFDNCKYNGEKVTSLNYGKPNNVIVGYDFNHDGETVDVRTLGITNIEFK